MPELPEVETCRRALEPLVVGAQIRRVTLRDVSSFYESPRRVIQRALAKATICALRRRGKYLLFDMARSGKRHGSLLIHLGMTGQLFAALPDDRKHLHVLLELSGATPVLVFRDPRRFGKVAWISAEGEAAHPRLARLGNDALTTTQEELWGALRGRLAPIKSVLLDQGVLAGVGNIYADESLFAARIRPTRKARSLSHSEVQRLMSAIHRTLARAIAAGGSSISDYRKPDGSTGYFQIQHQVYGHEGQPCRRCQTTIQRMLIGQRSSHFCPRCQK